MDERKRDSSTSSSINGTTMRKKRHHHHHSSDSDQYSSHHRSSKRHRHGDLRRDHRHHRKHKHKHKHSEHASSYSNKKENNITVTENTQSDNDTLEKLKQLAKQYNKTIEDDDDHKKREKRNIKNSKYHHEQEGINKQRREAMIPQTKESYDKQRSVIRREYDPQTGRTRLVKGSGEILESIVTGEQHRKINKQSTIQDGLSFQATIHNNRIK
ncbi:nuclear RNA-splicing-associated protein-domain-containing protein [Circinella umbellata]|nr:nuclear RNA-splicing-associated protein-domain-containing protein [Circinella umbellata]